MSFQDDFFERAQAAFEAVVRAHRDTLIRMNGAIAIEYKQDSSPVTEQDRRMETELRAALKSVDASIGFEGEEFGIEGNRQTFWLIDPIDGTEAFTRGLPGFRNMATLIDDGQVVFAMVYKPIFDELYIARKGQGAYKNNQPIHVSSRGLAQARIEIHSPGSKPEMWKLMAELSKHVNAVRIMGDFMPVADGGLDALLVYKGGGGPWDFAPRSFLIAEAGGRVANIGTETYDYRQNNMLAANPVIFDELMALIVEITSH